MLLKSGDGIRCDKCGMAYSDDFLYYSFDVRDIVVHDNIVSRRDYKSTPIFSFDICQACIDYIKTEIIKHHKPLKLDQTRRCKQFHCDLSPTTATGNYTFYHVVIDEVRVQMSGRPITCDKCQTTVSSKDEPCPNCSSTKLSRKADMAVDDRYLELDICEEIFTDFKDKAIKLRENPEAGEWSK